MKAIVFNSLKTAHYEDVCDPKILLGEVLIEVHAAGLCGSDINKIKDPEINLEGKILGHEISGRIIDSKSNRDVVGKRISMNPIISCGNCIYCEFDQTQLCENIIVIGRDVAGGFAEYISVPENNIRELGDEVSYEEGCLTDMVACALHAYNLSGAPKQKKAVIIGDGPAAMVLAQILSDSKNDVLLFGKHEYNLSIMKTLGVDSIHFDYKQRVEKNSSHLVFDMVGGRQDAVIIEAIRLVAPRGKIVSFGVYPEGYAAKIFARELFYKEASLIGSNAHGTWHGVSEFDSALQLISSKKISLKHVLANTLPLHEFNKGLNLKYSHKCIKQVYTL